jgi:hypothetical protein
LAAALLLLPVVVLVATMPQWVERRHVATIVARESAGYAAESFPADTEGAVDVGRVVATNHGVSADDVRIVIVDDATRGGQVEARVTIVMPAVVVPLIGSIGRQHHTVIATVRIDDYRSRT